MSEVEKFFAAQQRDASYEALKTLTRGVDRAAADILNAEIYGRTLSVGGVWEFYAPGPKLSALVCLDLSAPMLESYAPAGAQKIVGDLFETELPENSFDGIVFSLILHHVAQGDWLECERRIHDALTRAQRWLKPGGTVFILEYCPHPAWMPIQRLLLPLTRLFLKIVGQPLVVMHDRGFYDREFAAAGFRSASARRISAPGVSDWTWFPVFMAVPWLKLPLKLYPKMYVLTALKPD